MTIFDIKDGDQILSFEEMDIPVSYSRGTSDTVVFHFHGAVARDSRTLPVYQPKFRPAFGAHQISIGDPSLYLDPDISSAWYAGCEGFYVQSVLIKLFQEIISELKVNRVVFAGGSVGGFAALFFSYHFPKSIALAVAPQTNIRTYLNGLSGQRANHFLKTFWPKGLDHGEENGAIFDLATLYSRGMKNSIVMLNSSGDRNHIFNHSLPLLQSIQNENQGHVLSHIDYYGVSGHSGAIPFSIYNKWFKAIFHSPNWSAQGILNKLWKFEASRVVNPTLTAKNDNAGFAGSDCKKADLIKHFLLEEG